MICRVTMIQPWNQKRSKTFSFTILRSSPLMRNTRDHSKKIDAIPPSNGIYLKESNQMILSPSEIFPSAL